MIWRKALAVLKKDAIEAIRSRNLFVLAIAAQGAQMATFYYLSSAVGPQFRPEGIPYFLFLIAGTGFYTFLLAAPYSFLRTIQEAQQTGTLEVLLTTATPAPALVLLCALSAFVSNLLQFLIYVGAAFFLVTARMHINMIGFLAVFSLSIVIAFAIGLFAAGLQISIHKGSALLWLLGSGAWLMSGTLFPVATLPRFIRAVSFAIPFTHSISGMRLALVSHNPAGLIHEIEVLAFFSLFLLPAGLVFFSWMVRQARHNGTLAFS